MLDMGTHCRTPADCPDSAEAVALAVRDGRAERNALICSSAVGASVSARV